MCNSAIIGNIMMMGDKEKAISQLRAALPDNWSVAVTKSGKNTKACKQIDGSYLIEVLAPDGISAEIITLTKPLFAPAQVTAMAGELQLALEGAVAESNILIFAPFISMRSQELLRAFEFNYLDETGNVFIKLNEPAVFVKTTGAEKNPKKMRRELPGLKGAKAASIIRSLIGWKPPMGIRDLANLSSADPGYVSRLARALEQEDLIERSQTGTIIRCDWESLLREWSKVYSFTGSNEVMQFFDARGAFSIGDKDTLLKLNQCNTDYLLTGSVVSAMLAPVAPIRTLMMYAGNPEAIAKRFKLTQANQGTNVLIAKMPSAPLYPRLAKRYSGSLNCAPLSQAAADLLTGPGRNPSEAEELVRWMRENEDDWRSGLDAG
jgi:predicted transcriptional regulator